MHSRNPIWPMSMHWLLFWKSLKGHVEVVVSMVISSWVPRQEDWFKHCWRKSGRFRASASSMTHGATEQSFARRVLAKLWKVKPSNGSSWVWRWRIKLCLHWQYSMELQNQKAICSVQGMRKSISHLLNILGRVIWAHHVISLISLLSCMMWKVLMSLFMAAVVIYRQPRKGNCVAI